MDRSTRPRSGSTPSSSARIGSARRAGLVALLATLALAGLIAHLGQRAQRAASADDERAAYLAVARRAATGLTTIDHRHAEADLGRLLDTATGRFRADLERRAPRLVSDARDSGWTSTGTVTEAAVLDPVSATGARVLVAVRVAWRTVGEPGVAPGGAAPAPRDVRMRIGVERVENGTLEVGDVDYVA